MRIKTTRRYQKQDTKVHDVIVNIRGGGASIAESDEDEEVEVVNETAKLHILVLLAL
jgi:carbon monoxide dehydrogenase subunit G